MVGGKIFNTKHRVNEFKHVEPVKQKKRSLASERNESIHTQVEELTKANILREVKYQTWVSNLVIAKKADERHKLFIEFTDINKACPKENHSLPATESKVKDIHQHRLNCFLDAYKGYHQISIAKKDEEKRLSTQEKWCPVIRGQNIEVNAGEMVIKSDFEEEMLADIKDSKDSE
nr:reverse transcriptase domain-containing protein [Tanacetum cinerariifolium]